MVVNIQAAGQTHKQRSEERTGKWERTEYTDEKKQTLDFKKTHLEQSVVELTAFSDQN